MAYTHCYAGVDRLNKKWINVSENVGDDRVRPNIDLLLATSFSSDILQTLSARSNKETRGDDIHCRYLLYVTPKITGTELGRKPPTL